jgi:hypothetical protein
MHDKEEKKMHLVAPDETKQLKTEHARKVSVDVGYNASNKKTAAGINVLEFLNKYPGRVMGTDSSGNIVVNSKDPQQREWLED